MFEQRQQANSSTTIAEEDGSLAEVEKYFINVIATFLNFLYDKCWQSLNFNNKWLCSFVQKTSYGAATIKKKQKCINSPWKKETIFILNIEVKDIFCLQNEKNKSLISISILQTS